MGFTSKLKNVLTLGGYEKKKDYEKAVDNLDRISSANTGASGDMKARNMASVGSMGVGQATGQVASATAKSAGLNEEAAEAVGANTANEATQNAFTDEYNKATQANQQEIAEAEQAANEANKARAEKGAANSKILGTIGSVAGTIAGGAIGGPTGAAIGGGLGGGLGSLAGSATVSDSNAKNKWLLNSISKYSKTEKKLKNEKLKNREW